MLFQDSAVKEKLIMLADSTGYEFSQKNGQRLFGPPRDWKVSLPQRGCEVFIGKFPRDCFEDEIFPLFSCAGKIHSMRVMMDFSGFNRGFGFVKYFTPAEAEEAVNMLNGIPIRSNERICVAISLDNKTLFISGIPPAVKRAEVLGEFSARVSGIVDIEMSAYTVQNNTEHKEGFAFIEFDSHNAAAMARRILIPTSFGFWDTVLAIDWATPKPVSGVHRNRDVNQKVLFCSNINSEVSDSHISLILNNAVKPIIIEHIKVKHTFAFLSFDSKFNAEMALQKLIGLNICGINIEVSMNRAEKKIYNNNTTSKQVSNTTPKQLSNNLATVDDKNSISIPRSRCDSGLPSDCGSSLPNDSSPRITSPTNQDSDSEKWSNTMILKGMCKSNKWLEPEFNVKAEKGGMSYYGSINLPYVLLPDYSEPVNLGPVYVSDLGSECDVKNALSFLILKFLKDKYIC